MNFFVTGASGYIGSSVVRSLIAAGHRVRGLAREASRQRVASLQADVVIGDLRDVALLEREAAQADGVAHIAVEYSQEMATLERGAVEALLRGSSGRAGPVLFTSGSSVAGNTGDALADESTPYDPIPSSVPRVEIEKRILAAEGVRPIVIRPTWVYGGSRGLETLLAGLAAQNGFVPVAGDGANSIDLVHVDDVGEVYRLALERGDARGVYIAATDRRLTLQRIAELVALSTGTRVEHVTPERYDEAFGYLAVLAPILELNQKMSGAKARRELGWVPHGPSFEEAVRAVRVA